MTDTSRASELSGGNGFRKKVSNIVAAEQLSPGTPDLLPAANLLPQRRAWVLVRVSALVQQDNYSSESQEQESRKYAAPLGFVVDEVRQEIFSVAAESDERPVLREVRAAVRDRKMDALIIYRLNRMTRAGGFQALELAMECERHGVELHLVIGDPRGKIDVSTFVGQLRVLHGGRQAAEELKAQVEAISRGLWTRTAAYGFPRVGGKSPYGWTLVDGTHPVTGKSVAKARAEINGVEAEVLRQVCEELVAGRALHGIVTRLTTEGVPAPNGGKAWSVAGLRRILRDPRLKGEAYSYVRTAKPVDGVTKRGRKRRQIRLRPLEQRVRLPAGTFPAIISAELWDAVQARLDASAKLAEQKRSSRPTTLRDTLVRGVATCGICGHRLQRRQKRSGDWVYFCDRTPWNAEAHAEHNDPHPMITAKVLDNAVWRAICHVCRDPKVVQYALEKQQQGDGAELRADLAAAIETRDLLRSQEHRAVRNSLLLADEQQQAMAQVTLDLLAQERTAAEVAVTTAERRLAEQERVTERYIEAQALLWRLAPRLDAASETERHEIVHLLVEWVKVWPENSTGAYPSRYTVKLVVSESDALLTDCMLAAIPVERIMASEPAEESRGEGGEKA